MSEKISCGVSGRSLKVSGDIAVSLSESKKKRLIQERKLILVLDLDHTLIHTVSGTIKETGVFTYEIDGNCFSTKLRPFLHEFLDRLQAMYEMCVYTMGSHKYANQIAHLVDPEQKYFGSRIFSKDDSESKSIKSLKLLLPFDDSMALILDDTYEVWPDCENLVLADRFLYFQDCEEMLKRCSGESDHYLYFIADLFIRVHERFYAKEGQDVKSILKSYQCSILNGVRMVLSGVINRETDACKNYYWQLAERFGASCQPDLTETTTHVVAQTMGTKKTKVALKQHVPVVNLLWLHLSSSFWLRLPEDYFKFENINHFDIKALLNLPMLKRASIEDQEVEKKIRREEEKNSSEESESDAEVSD